jgi:tetratricopeptide (TPR) repeat protein
VIGNDSGHLTEETLTEYLEGSLEPAVRAVSEVHVVSCDKCRVELAVFMRLLSEEVGAEEESSLRVIAAQWDRKQNDLRLPRSTGTFPAWFLALIGVAAVLLIGVISGFVLERRSEPQSPSEVVQLLLSKNRPFESRMSNEPHREIVGTRGVEDPALSYSSLASEMTKMGASTNEMGRFWLVQKDLEHATQYLELAAAEPGATAADYNDLGVVYLESGDFFKRGKARLQFELALKQDPQFAAAIFNLALFYERTDAVEQAKAEWNRYLGLDPNSGWAKEASDRLQALSR